MVSGWGRMAGESFIREMAALGIDFGEIEDAVRLKINTIFETAHRRSTDESKKAAFCWLLFLSIERGDYGDPSVEPLLTLREHLNLCFDRHEMDGYDVETLWDVVDASRAGGG